MDMADINIIVTEHNGQAIVDQVNNAFYHGIVTEVNGYELVSRFGSPVARAWQNGTVSFTVRGRTRGKINDIYVKVGKAVIAH